MSFSWTERKDSRRVEEESGAFELRYSATGSSDETFVFAYATSATPVVTFAAGKTMYRQNITLDPRGPSFFVVTSSYSPRKNEMGEYSFSFDTTGGTIVITQSYETLQSYKATGVAGDIPNHKGAIDVQGNDVKGTTVVIPALKMTYRFKHPLGVVNESLARNLARATGKTNNDIWHGFRPGECLFLGATGEDGSDSPASVDYSIACSENVTGLTIGDIANVAKRGWDAIWVAYFEEKDDDANERTMRPKYAYVERVYREMNFAQTLGF